MGRNSFWSRVAKFFGGGADGPAPVDGVVSAPAPVPGPPGYATLRAGVASAVGTVREHNEDNYFLPADPPGGVRGGDGDHRKASEFRAVPGEISIFLVADGMGGQLAGEKASQMAVDLIPKEISRRIGPGEDEDKLIQRSIRDAVAAANQEILGLSHIQTEFSNMGTTVVLIVFRNNRAYIAGIGDSRAYRIRDGRIEQLTKDHSLADALLEAGTISADELPNHKFKHILYLYLGSKDARGGPDEVRVTDVRPGDRFLLASDGLTGVVEDEEVARIVSGGGDPLATASRLLERAIENESKDNVTCMVIFAL